MADKASVIKEAQKYLAKGQIDKAIAEWEKLLPCSDANVYNIIGDLYLKKGDKNKAAGSYHQASAIFRKEGFSLKALALYKKILNINPQDPRSHLALGELNEEKNISTDAIKYYLAAADMFLRSNQKPDAVSAYKKILKIAGTNIKLRVKIADLFSKEGFVEDTANEYVEIAKLYGAEGDLEKAKSFLERSIEIKPGNRNGLITLGHLYERAGDYTNAINIFKRAIEETGKSNDLLLKTARLALEMGNDSEAKEYAGAAVESDPSNIESKKLLADIHLKAGDLEEAWKEYAPILDELIFMNRHEEAVEKLLLFKETEPVEARRKLITFYKQQNRNDEALNELRELGEILEESGMLEEAKGCYQEALTIGPEDADLKGKVSELDKVPSPKEEGETRDEKSPEQILTEAEIFIGYNLFEDARKLLEGLKLRAPANLELHVKLKAVYKGTGDKEQAITECIILSELYKRGGDQASREAVIKEAFSINPEDPRILERFGQPPRETESFRSQSSPAAKPSKAISEKLETEPVEEVSAETGPAEQEIAVPAAHTEVEDIMPHLKAEETPAEDILGMGGTVGSIDEYGEDLSEADFYMKQELYNEAEAIYKRVLANFPHNDSVRAKLKEIQEIRAEREKEQEAVAAEEAAELATVSLDDIITDAETPEEIAEPPIQNEVLEIFEEFKKGLEKELAAEDTETRYNLGIAYKEMGLVDDAIKEFQVAKHDPKLFINSATMLGVCYMEKNLYPLAIEALQSALMKVTKKEQAHWGLKYDLALAYEKSGQIKEAFDLYMEVYGWDSKFRDVQEKINLYRVRSEPKNTAEPIPAEAVPAEELSIEPLEEAGHETGTITPKAPENGGPTTTKKNRVSYI